MKNLPLTRGAGLPRLTAVVVVIGALCCLVSALHAQSNVYTLEFIGFPSGNIQLSQYIGLDRKLKSNVPGSTLRISVSPPLPATKAQLVQLRIYAIGEGTTVSECNTTFASAVTDTFSIRGAGRDLGVASLTGSSSIGVQSSTQNQSCIDALSNRLQQGIASLPAGSYRIDATLMDATSGRVLTSGSYTVLVTGASTNEAVINLSSPQSGELVTQSANVVFSFNNGVPGRLLAFEHSSFSQSPEDATRDSNSPLKVLDEHVVALGSNQLVGSYPGNAVRPWLAGKKYSWLFLGDATGGETPARSPIFSFVVISNDPIITQLVTTLSSSPDPIGSTFANLMNSGYTLTVSSSNQIYLQDGDGGTPRAVDLSQVLTLLADLAQRGVKLTTSISNQ